ncbi:kinase-like domain-containing protein [Lophiotrema nucula]|uniref:Kinase-like domain-containing protein n=1 Tax=Lophiotrema nucula TaxID=690887 RepID=A0A6A5YEI2_9PLEO|nr:kinase-like domain-containing protein [Lophiotrema nucula]
MIDVDLAIYYNPGIPGVLLIAEDRVIKFGKNYFCPIVLGQLVHNRYRVLSLLGWGGYAMVWLAVDQCSSPSPKYVALKIFRGAEKSNDEYSSNEERQLRKLILERDRGGIGRRNIIELFDAFEVESSNGVHRCLVLEPAGCSFADLVTFEEFGFDDVVYIFRQCVEAVEYLHSRGISHGDLDLANLVLALPDFSGLTEADVISKLLPDPKGCIIPIKMKDGTPLPPGVPESICSPCPFYEPKLDLDDLQVKLIDFGEAFTGTKPDVHTHSRNRPPELIEQGVASSSSDIWALGCIFWHLLTGYPLMSYFEQGSSKERYQGQRKFLSMTRQERRGQLTSFLARKFGQSAVDDEEYTGAILDVLLNTLEPTPSDRPTAGDLLSYSIFSLIKDVEASPDNNAQAVSDSRKPHDPGSPRHVTTKPKTRSNLALD